MGFMRPLLRAARLAAALAAVVVVAACSGDSEATLLSSARGYLDKHDAKAAVIQLKNLLQKNPDSGPARLLMGRALSELGDPAGAMVEYRKAQALHVADEDLLPEMARAMMLTGEAAKVTAQFAGTELKHESANADLHATVGAAFALQGNVEQAKAQSARALQASPTESHGHTKKGYAYFFQGDYVQQHNSKSASASWREQQLAEGKKSIAQNSNDAYGHDITGIALFRLAEINAENKKPSQKLLDGAYDHFEAALKINPSFPWAYNDFAIALLVEAQDKSQHNQNPLQAIEKVIETAKKAITADESYIYAYNTITLAAMTISAWQVKHGINPSHYVEIGRNAAQRSIALNNKYTPAIGNLGNLYMILSFYDFISGNKIDEHYELAIKHFRSISDIDKNDLIPYISIPIVRYFEAGAKLDGDGDPAPAIEAGLELAAQGLKLAPDEPYCLEIQSRLHGAKALWLKKQGRPHLAELELASRLSKQALVKIPEEQDALLGGAEIAYQLADAQLGRGKRPATIVQEGLTAVERALASAAGTPRALALRGALLSLRGKLEPNRKQKQATLQAAQTAFAESFGGNPLLRRRYEGIQREVEELLAGL